MAQIELIVCRQHDRTHPDGYDSKSCEARDSAEGTWMIVMPIGIPMIEILGKKKASLSADQLGGMFWLCYICKINIVLFFRCNRVTDYLLQILQNDFGIINHGIRKTAFLDCLCQIACGDTDIILS